MFRTVPLSIIRSFTAHTAMVYVIQFCWQFASRIRTSWSCWSQAVWHIPLLRVQWKTPDDRQRNCPKHVEFYSKNKFGKLVHLVGFIIRIYHDAARSPERQMVCIMIAHALSQRRLLTVRTDLIAEFAVRIESCHSLPHSTSRHPKLSWT